MITFIAVARFQFCSFKKQRKWTEIWQERVYICSVTNVPPCVCSLSCLFLFCSLYLSWLDLLSPTKDSANNQQWKNEAFHGDISDSLLFLHRGIRVVKLAFNINNTLWGNVTYKMANFHCLNSPACFFLFLRYSWIFCMKLNLEFCQRHRIQSEEQNSFFEKCLIAGEFCWVTSNWFLHLQ